MPICQGKLTNGDPCPKTVEEGQTLCPWHGRNEEDWRNIYRRLALSKPLRKTEMVIKLIEEHPENHLELPDQADLTRIDLKGLQLASAKLQGVILISANLQGVSLAYADLQGAILDSANLQKANLRSANLQNASLKRANLQDANLGSANLQYAILEEADLQDAYLGKDPLRRPYRIPANLQNAILRSANLQSAKLGSAKLQFAILENANLQSVKLGFAKLHNAKLINANLQEADLESANLHDADLSFANLQGAHLENAQLLTADLRSANLHNAYLQKANLHGADLRQAKLQGVDLSNVKDMAGVCIVDAWLDRTRIRRDQFGDAIVEERNGDYATAKRGYLAIKQNFDDLGDYDASSWAYRKERRMEKLEVWRKGQKAIQDRKWKEAAARYFEFAGDTFIEWLCDYGESVWRVMGWMAALILIGPFLFWALGGFVWPDNLLARYSALATPLQRYGFIVWNHFLYTMDVLTTASLSDLQPRNDLVKLFSYLLSITGIFLTGLLGFVAGNRIRRS